MEKIRGSQCVAGGSIIICIMTNKKISSEPTEQNTGPHRVLMSQWISCAPFEQLLHMDIQEASDGKAVLTMPFLHDFAQGMGLLHGGALVSLADTAVVMAIKSILSPSTHFATVSMESRFLYPVKQGIVTARATAIQQEERILHGQATVYNEEGKPVMEFSSVSKIARDQKKSTPPEP
jgi:acyl-CoA thioesterase